VSFLLRFRSYGFRLPRAPSGVSVPAMGIVGGFARPTEKVSYCAVRKQGNQGRSAAAKRRERNADGTLASSRVSRGTRLDNDEHGWLYKTRRAATGKKSLRYYNFATCLSSNKARNVKTRAVTASRTCCTGTNHMTVAGIKNSLHSQEIFSIADRNSV
jgi:hypothetical protein